MLTLEELVEKEFVRLRGKSDVLPHRDRLLRRSCT